MKNKKDIDVMKEKSIKLNIILSTVYQVLTMSTLFITAPYVSRILMPDGVGIYSYTHSISAYFTMFAALGTVSYGTREIARSRNDKKLRSRLFWEIELLTVITTIFALAVWGIFILLTNEYREYYLILSFSILAVLFDVSWFYSGLEEFWYTVSINSLFKIGSVIATFVFVKTVDDLGTYMLIMMLALLLGNVSMWLALPRFLTHIKICELRILRHFKETLIYFVPTIATSIYTICDKTLIGVITRDSYENGYYEQATKVLSICKALTFTALNSVLGSRISYLFVEKRYEEIRTRIEQSVSYILFIGIGICFGLLSVIDEFVPLFFGDGYDETAVLIKILSSMVIIIGISNCLCSQYYNPAGYRSKSAKFLIVGSIINFCLNILLIPIFGSKGAAVASVIAELVITWLYLYFCDGYLTVSTLFKFGWKRLVAGSGMLAVLDVWKEFISNGINLTMLCIRIVVGVVVYMVILLVLKDDMFNAVFTYVKKLRRVKK